MPNEIVAALLKEYADLLEISGGDQFRARNYEKAAKSVAGFSGDVDLLDASTLRQIPGVGASIATKIVEFRETGAIQALEKLRATVPDGVREMTKIPALGPRRALQLYRELGIGSVAELSAAIDEGRLRDLRGFGPKSEDKTASTSCSTTQRPRWQTGRYRLRSIVRPRARQRERRQGFRCPRERSAEARHRPRRACACRLGRPRRPRRGDDVPVAVQLPGRR